MTESLPDCITSAISRLTGHSLYERQAIINPLTGTEQRQYSIQQYGAWYTLAVDGWTVTFGTARTDLSGLWPRPVPSSLYQM